MVNIVNSILRYYKPIGVPNPHGPLSSKIPSKAIELANKGILSKLKESPYRHYTPEERANIRKYATDHGVNTVVIKYSINESTVRSFKNAYPRGEGKKRNTGDRMKWKPGNEARWTTYCW